MARRTQDITFGIAGQTVEYRVPQGRPTSATFSVFDDGIDDDGTAEFSGTATVDSVDTTVDAASGASQTDPQTLNLTATTGIVLGRKYLVSENEKKEWVEPIEIVTDDYIRTRHPLKNDYTTSAVFESTYITAAVDATWVADDGHMSDQSDPNPDYRLLWTITLSSGTEKAYTFFDLVRVKGDHGLTIEDLNLRHAGLVDKLPLEYRTDRGQSLLDEAYAIARTELHGIDLNDAGIRDQEAIDELTKREALILIAQSGVHPPGFSSGEYLQTVQDQRDRWWEMHFQVTNKHDVDTGDGGDGSPFSQVPFWRK